VNVNVTKYMPQPAEMSYMTDFNQSINQ